MHLITSIIERCWRFCLDCLFPKECVRCGREGEYLCAECEADFRPSYPSTCFGCKKALGQKLMGELCEECQPRFAFDGVVIAADYEDETVKRLIRDCKYRFVREMSGYVGGLLTRKLEAFLRTGNDRRRISRDFFHAVVMPVPLSPQRLKWRGFNQAELLAGHFAQFSGLSHDGETLERRHRRAQARLSEAERRRNVAGSFRTAKESPLLVILIDDVVTTGSTLHECAKALKQNGAEEVWCFVAAKG